jgi:hypothetical protein
MTIESAVAALTASTTALTTAVGTQQLAVTAAVGNFTATTNRVNALNNVNNTADADKPVSTATVAAIALKQATLVSGINISTVNGQSLLGGSPLIIERSATSLNRVTYDNRATLRALSPQLDDSTMIESLGLFMWINTKLEPEDDETCFNTANGQWLLRVPAWDLLDAWALHEQSITDDLREDESLRFAAYTLANK